ncbi:hypothetical protein [uncultured Ferrimonas sp.]|uniref:hypothetical protein n=1 Tax=uncultured Ferrimonas sp. TaxID=432640 RepID=UPI00262CAADE|nr:hypothetical protein [uncultured Ferrimonas sp.]
MLVILALFAAPQISHKASCWLTEQCANSQQKVGWVQWLVSSSGQLHFFNLLELFHQPNSDNHF